MEGEMMGKDETPPGAGDDGTNTLAASPGVGADGMNTPDSAPRGGGMGQTPWCNPTTPPQQRV